MSATSFSQSSGPLEVSSKDLTKRARQFQEAYCAYYNCASAEYQMHAFRKCLYWHARPFVSLLQRLDPDFFREDLDFIREVGHAANVGEFRTELNRFYGRNLRDKSWLRAPFLLRVSAKKLLKIKRRIGFAE